MKSNWIHSIRSQIIIAILVIFALLGASLGYTLYALRLRQHDYLILNLSAQLRVLSQTMLDQAIHYQDQAPDDYDKYNRDLGTYWQDLQKQTELYQTIITALQTRQLDKKLTGHHETIYCNFDKGSRSQLQILSTQWFNFNAGLKNSLGSNLKEPKLTAASGYITKSGDTLIASSNKLATEFQRMMEVKVNQIRLFLGISIGLGLALVLGMFYVTRRTITNPIKATLTGFDRVSRGDFQAVVPVTGKSEIAQMAMAFNHLTERLNAMFRLTDKINQGKQLDEMLQFIYEEFQSFVPLDWVGVFYLTPDGERISLERFFTLHTSSLLQGALFALPANMMESGGKPIAFSLKNSAISNSQLSICLADEGLNATASVCLINKLGLRATMLFATKEKNYTADHLEFLSNIASVVSNVLEKTLVMENLVRAAVEGLAKLAESRDPETGDHLIRMAQYSMHIAEELAQVDAYKHLITPAYVRDIFHFAPMHDIGKVGIRDDVLLKPVKLDEAEMKEMQRHPTIGADVLKKAEQQIESMGHSIFKVGIEIAAGHHEKYDGSGYPAQLKGEEIPLSARIVAAADVFDALTSKRPYKEAWPIEQALALMDEQTGKHFDPAVMAAMKRALPRMLVIYERLKHV